MSGSNARSNAIRAITSYKPDLAPLNYADTKPTEIYGSNVFSDKVMKERLPRIVYKSLRKTIEQGVQLDPSLADIVASTMKDWAIEKGATHFTHVFYPLTGHSAEKHDGFLSPDGNGGVITEFSGKMLSQGEADGSSFPSGGLRSTFEARGYTAWDVTSPAYLMENSSGIVLCIPTAFLSWTGVALDRKTPLLRSNQALNKQASRILKLFGKKTSLPIISYSGLEQEFFLIDRNFVFGRPDLLTAGRTLFGAKPAKGQEFEDQYYGVMPRRVMSCITEAERELYKLGVPVRTHHNEVAPSQYEIAPVFETANLAIDHNQLMMTVLKKVAKRHGLHCLLHEKPFSGINGSGKHNNWSLGTDTGVNLFGPGKTASENLQFITFLVNAISAVHKHNGLLKAAIMSATNAHRLGANEAPPAIISTFLGTQVSAVLDKLAASKGDDAIRFDAKNVFKMSGISHIPTLLLDNTDRNRTSPFAFTGNRFEFRAVGSSDNCAEAMIVLNTAMAYELTEFRKKVDAKIEAGMKKEKAIYEVLKQMIKACKAVRFDGNGYSDEWKAEAKKRGLDCETSTPLIFERYLDKATLEMFGSMGVFTDVELEARTEVKWETYTKKIQIEGRVLGDLAMNHIVPIASKYEALLLDKVYKMSQIPGLNASADIALIKKIQYHTAEIQRLTGEMIDARKKANKIEQMREKAIAYHDTVSVFFDEIRRHIDKLEEIVDDQMWPLPKYRELLFLR